MPVFKIVMKNLHHLTLISGTCISGALSESDHSASRFVNVIKNCYPIPLFLVDVKSNTNNKEVLSILIKLFKLTKLTLFWQSFIDLSSILYTKIKVKLSHRTNNGPPHRRNGQIYGLTANYFHRAVLSVRKRSPLWRHFHQRPNRPSQVHPLRGWLHIQLQSISKIQGISQTLHYDSFKS